jgi:hypothetical protein
MVVMANPASIDTDAVCQQLLGMFQDNRGDDAVNVVRELLGKLATDRRSGPERIVDVNG